MTSGKKLIRRCGTYTDGRQVRLTATDALDFRAEAFTAMIE